MNADQSKHMTEKVRSGLSACWGKAIDANNTVARYVEKGLSHTGVKGSWLPAVSRWLMPTCMGIVLVGVAISGDPQSSFGAPSLPGRELDVQINTATAVRTPLPEGLVLVSDFLNSGLTNMRVSADEEDGTLHLLFDFDPEDWVAGFQGKFPPTPLLVRLFDKNGEYITHFTTAERYIPSVRGETLAEKYGGVMPYKKTRFLEPTGNELIYSLSMRDLTFARIAEIGWYDNKTVLNLKDELEARKGGD